MSSQSYPQKTYSRSKPRGSCKAVEKAKNMQPVKLVKVPTTHGYTCGIPTCPYYKKKSTLLLFPMPIEPEVKEMWCKAFNINKNLADSDFRICALHFKSKSGILNLPTQSSPPKSETISKPAPKVLPNVLTVVINNNNYKILEPQQQSRLPNLNPPIPPDLSQELSTRATNLEKVKFLKQAVSKIENANSGNMPESQPDSTQPGTSEVMVVEPELSQLIASEADASDEANSKPEDSDFLQIEPDVILQTSDENSVLTEDNREMLSDPSLDLDCEDEELSEIQLDTYMKELVEFCSANQTVYRLTHTSNVKFPSIKKSDAGVKNNNLSLQSNVLTEGGSVPQPNSNINSNASTAKLFPNSILVSAFPNNDVKNATSSSFIPFIPTSSSVTDVTKKFSIVQDSTGKIITQNISSNLSVNGNVIFSKSLSINPTANNSVGTLPAASNPVSINTSLPLVQNINYNPVSQGQVAILKNNPGSALSTAIPPKLHFLTPISSVSQLQTINSQPLTVVSHQQGNIPYILSPFVSTGKSLPSTVVFSYAPIANSSELKTVFSSPAMPPAATKLNSPKTSFKLVPALNHPRFSVPSMVKTGNSSKYGLDKVGPVSFKNTNSTYQRKSSTGHPNPTSGESSISKSDGTTPEIAVPSIQIVGVIGAKDGGAGEFFGKQSSIPEDKKDLKESDKEDFSEDVEVVDVETVCEEEVDSEKDPEFEDKSEARFVCYKTRRGKVMLSKMDSVFVIQKKIPNVYIGFKTIDDIQSLFSIQRGDVKNRLTDADELRKKLKSAEFVSDCIPWMLKKKYLPSVSPCYKCGDSILMLEKSNNFQDGYCYTCYNSNCRSQTLVKRCSFFDRFRRYSTECLLLLTYHWACMSPLQEILLDIEMEPKDIWAYFQALQQLCTIDVNKNLKLGTPYGNYVEACVVRLGQHYVLGAFDRKTKFVRIEALSEEEARESMATVKLLKSWLNQDSFLVCEKAVPDGILPGIKTLVADPSASARNETKSTLPHTLNITDYLKRALRTFSNYFITKGCKNFVNNMLYERQWREKFYRFGVEGAFWAILDVIKEQNKFNGSKVATIGIPQQNAVIKPKGDENVHQMRWGLTITKKCTAIPEAPISSTDLSAELKSEIRTYDKQHGKFTSKGAPRSDQKGKVHSGASDLIVTKQGTGGATLVSLLRDIPEISGEYEEVTNDTLLQIRVKHIQRLSELQTYQRNADELGETLKNAHFYSQPVKWLVKKNFINHVSSCYVCGGTAYLRDNSKFSDGCSWSCQNATCKFENTFKRPRFFARFPHQSMGHLLAIVFHWVVQTEPSKIISDINIDSMKLVHTFRALQTLCVPALGRGSRKVGGPSHMVELVAVQHGNKYILGIYDRLSHMTVMKAFHKDLLTDEAFHNFIKKYVRPRSDIIVNAHPDFRLPPTYHLKIADPTLTEKYNEKPHVLNVTSYMLNHLFSMFGKFNALRISPTLLQRYLDELMWRERFDAKPLTSFCKIMGEIFLQDIIVNEVEDDFIDIGESKELPSNPPILKEARIVLKRIPKTVLKYYNCLESDSSQSSADGEIYSKRRTTTKTDLVASSPSTSSNLESSSSNLPLTRTVLCEEVIATPSDLVFNLKEQVHHKRLMSDEEYMAEESHSDEVSSADEFNPTKKLDQFKWTAERRSKRRAARGRRKEKSFNNFKSSKSPSFSDSLEACMMSDSSRTSTSTSANHSVQPLVINVCRKNKKPKFFIKSDSSGNVSPNENSVDNSISDVISVKSHQSSEIDVVGSPVNLNAEATVHNEEKISTGPVEEKLTVPVEEKLTVPVEKKLTRPVVADQKTPVEADTSEKDKKKSGCTLKRHLDDTLECKECGEALNPSMDHFVKSFECGDCKNCVYTTCCSSAFFEHRGSLLFGKRMPKRVKQNKGLHRSITLPQPWYCKCGFNSTQGNKLASHLMKCPKSLGFCTNKQ